MIKLDHAGIETHRYQGRVLDRADSSIILEAFFDRDDIPVDHVLLNRGDRFIEFYYTDRWYNIFEVHDRKNDSIKCWYCNISSPAVIMEDRIIYKDMALDLLVYPDGQQVILDEAEFNELPLDKPTREKAQAALAELREKFSSMKKKSGTSR